MESGNIMHNPKILLIDGVKSSSEQIVKFIKNSLEIEILIATTPAEAQNAIDEQHCDLVVAILDAYPDETQNSEIILGIKNSCVELPVIILYTKETENAIRKNHQIKIVDYLPRPETENEAFMLINKLRVFIDLYTKTKRLESEITEREKAEQKYKELIDFTKTAYVIMDMKFRIVDANKTFIDLMRIGAVDEITGCNLRTWVASNDMKIFDDAFNSLRNGQIIQDLEITMVNSSSESVHLAINANVCKNGHEKILCLMRDISLRKYIEHKKFIEMSKKKDRIRQELNDIKTNIRDFNVQFDKKQKVAFI